MPPLPWDYRHTRRSKRVRSHIEFFAVPKFVGTSITFKIKWEGDEWIQSGTLPLKALGLSDHDVQIQERYRRIK